MQLVVQATQLFLIKLQEISVIYVSFLFVLANILAHCRNCVFICIIVHKHKNKYTQFTITFTLDNTIAGAGIQLQFASAYCSSTKCLVIMDNTVDISIDMAFVLC